MTRRADPRLYRVTLVVCARCLQGDGAECWTPGCAFWGRATPAGPIPVEGMTPAD